MHIPENYLSPSTCAVMTAAMLPVWGYSINKVRTEIPKAKMPLLGIGAAFSFLGMMFNVPLPGGTTGHAVGGTLIAILTGSPAAGCIAVSIALLIQALLFGDGGVLAFGANCFNMAFVLPYLGFFFQSTGMGLILSLVTYLCAQLVRTAAFPDASMFEEQLFTGCFNIAAIICLVGNMSAVIYLMVLFWRDEHDLNTSGTAMNVIAVMISCVAYCIAAVLLAMSVMG